MLKNKVVVYIIFIILFVGFWILFDYLTSTFIVRKDFELTWFSLSMPLAVSVVVGYFAFLKKNKNDSSPK